MILCICISILLRKYALQAASDPAGSFRSLNLPGVWQKQLRAPILPDWSGSVKRLRRKHPRSLACAQANSYNCRMFDTHRFLLFFAAALVLAVTPGPGIFYVLARSLAGGRREGLLSSYGTFAGGLFHVLAAALGISAILAASATAFHTIKYAGAAYLLWLGIRMIRTRNEEMTVRADQPSRGAFRQGIFTEVLNPKTALFFLSFIPQFVTPARGHVFLQFVILGSLSVILNTSADLAVVLLASPLERLLKNSARFRRNQRVASGLGMIGLGAYAAFADTR
jgi:threonine/homoserine/homoserine lactone efflux protein